MPRTMASVTGCPQKLNGNMGVVRGRLVTMRVTWIRWRGTTQNSGDARLSGDWNYDKLKANNNRTHSVGSKLPTQLEASYRKLLVYSTCTATSGNGARIGITIVIMERQLTAAHG